MLASRCYKDVAPTELPTIQGNGKVSDQSQPPLVLGFWLGEPVGSGGRTAGAVQGFRFSATGGKACSSAQEEKACLGLSPQAGLPTTRRPTICAGCGTNSGGNPRWRTPRILLLYNQGTAVASQPATAGVAGRRLGTMAGNFGARGVDGLDSLLDAARQGAGSAPTPGPRAPTDASGIGSLPVTPLARPRHAPRSFNHRRNRSAGWPERLAPLTAVTRLASRPLPCHFAPDRDKASIMPQEA
jgi:hypothetical protein